MRKCTRCCIELKCQGKTKIKTEKKTISATVYECPNCGKLEYVREGK